ncbi:hypothetical protein GPDM_15774 [Planococcus donghaensis MPA1U2]|uniref:Uncharacterized protein n=1 Tax=Planococcus donghaensis MPA1U2 TaxID=933115 RepID=E7RKY0_9BACL|nr:hypothetical protein [Planococcus donghaensis]EGA88333.1 hypothetical protein GPDM_15774 [Planococcus donghaensis MPA1U2]
MMLKYFTKRYEVIMQGTYPASRKKIMLATLAKDIEKAYAIPLQRDPAWEQNNEEIFSLYSQVATRKDM